MHHRGRGAHTDEAPARYAQRRAEAVSGEDRRCRAAELELTRITAKQDFEPVVLIAGHSAVPLAELIALLKVVETYIGREQSGSDAMEKSQVTKRKRKL